MINYISYNYGRAKGSTSANTMFASSLNMGAADSSYTSREVDSEVIGSQDGTTKIFTTNLSWTPVVPGTLFVTDGTVTLADNGAGAFTGTGATGTIDYATGAIAITFTTAPTQDPSVSYQYNNENAPILNVPEVTLSITSLPVVAQSRKMKAVYAFDAAYELEKELTAA